MREKGSRRGRLPGAREVKARKAGLRVGDAKAFGWPGAPKDAMRLVEENRTESARLPATQPQASGGLEK
jgi:hypothetical protein